MQPAAHPTHEPAAGSWRVTREGAPVATVGLREERGQIVVAADVKGAAAKKKPFCFGTVEAANEFISDLMTSFSYLGCDIVRA
jgi:hypothetical protein